MDNTNGSGRRSAESHYSYSHSRQRSASPIRFERRLSYPDNHQRPYTGPSSGSFSRERDDLRSGLAPHTGPPRYFMIKSWNHENVEIAQQECLWASQEKNTDLFRDAYYESSQVILIFSVNKSMAFQGAVSCPPCRSFHWPLSSRCTIHHCLLPPSRTSNVVADDTYTFTSRQ